MVIPRLFALIAWSGQRVLSKVALSSLGTEKFYLLSAVGYFACRR